MGVTGSSWDMWKTGWTTQKCCGSLKVKEWDPGVPMISYRPRFFSLSFFKGWFVLKNFAFM